MSLKPEVSLTVALATGTLVWAIYGNALPPVADVRVAPAGNKDIQSSERLASWTAAGVVAGISLIAKDATVFVVGGTMVVALAWWHRHADQVSPLTQQAGQMMHPQPQTEEQAPGDYGYEDDIAVGY